MTVARITIQVASACWAKSPAVGTTERGGGNGEGKLVDGGTAHIHDTLDYRVAIVVFDDPEVSPGLRDHRRVPPGQAAHTGEVGRRRDSEMQLDRVEAAAQFSLDLHLPVHDGVPQIETHGKGSREPTLP